VTFSHLWSLYCLSFDLRLLITPLLSSNFSSILHVCGSSDKEKWERVKIYIQYTLSVIEGIFRYLLYNDFIFNIYSNGLRTSFHNLLLPLFKYIIYISTIYRRMLLVTYCDLHLDDLQTNALSDIL
jgi:hypothetical protein